MFCESRTILEHPFGNALTHSDPLRRRYRQMFHTEKMKKRNGRKPFVKGSACRNTTCSTTHLPRSECPLWGSAKVWNTRGGTSCFYDLFFAEKSWA
ncbi:hypothetical protein CEXT_247311 [Caerostris extrusa]|uniref:Uncharacterized protein n=1 Tax=Caerostris extrusa TaxID=172846 RepID=A0AAV4MFV1_CAEEX|nr:hypothetical protein CEXT_247311 [Caerostris extrusa]